MYDNSEIYAFLCRLGNNIRNKVAGNIEQDETVEGSERPEIITGQRSLKSPEELPHILIRERKGSIYLYTNYNVRKHSGQAELTTIDTDDETLMNIANAIAGIDRPDVSSFDDSMPDNDKCGYAVKLALRTAEKESESVVAGELSTAAKNIMLRIIHICCALDAAREKRGDGEIKKRKPVERLSECVIDLAVSGSSGSLSKEETTVLAAAAQVLSVLC